MDVQTIIAYMVQYGAVAVFIIVFLEYLNLPGFPAGVIMPVAGALAAQGGMSFVGVLLLSVLAGLCGSWTLYLLGWIGGAAFLEWFCGRFPRHAPAVGRTVQRIGEKGCLAVFLSKLLPAVRTIISIPAGALHMNFVGYTLSSALGIALWNLAFIGAGYVLGEAVFQMLPWGTPA